MHVEAATAAQIVVPVAVRAIRVVVIVAEAMLAHHPVVREVSVALNVWMMQVEQLMECLVPAEEHA